MITIQLPPEQERRLGELAAAQGENAAALAQRVVRDFIAFNDLPSDSADDWAEAAMKLAPEVFAAEEWSEGDATDAKG